MLPPCHAFCTLEEKVIKGFGEGRVPEKNKTRRLIPWLRVTSQEKGEKENSARRDLNPGLYFSSSMMTTKHFTTVPAGRQQNNFGNKQKSINLS